MNEAATVPLSEVVAEAQAIVDVEELPFPLERLDELTPESSEWAWAYSRRARLIRKKADAFLGQDAILTDDEKVELSALQSTIGEQLTKRRPRRTLDELLAGITPENLHEEWAPGPPVGRELL